LWLVRASANVGLDESSRAVAAVLRGPIARGGKLQFSGHETFPFRYGWLEKVADALGNSAVAGMTIFSPEFAMPRFGVGKNMVGSMRHWAVATGIARSIRQSDIELTELGKFLFTGRKAADPFLENPASLWLLHWNITSTPQQSTTWYWAFNHFSAVSFDRSMLVDSLLDLVRELRQDKASIVTLQKDVECFVRTYVLSKGKNDRVDEDSFACPLAELGLIGRGAGRDTYYFRKGPKLTLPDGVFNFALAEYWQREASAGTLSAEQIAYEPGSPGRVFKLDETSVVERLSRIDQTSQGAFRWMDTAGIRQVARRNESAPLVRLLAQVYSPTLRGTATT